MLRDSSVIPGVSKEICSEGCLVRQAKHHLAFKIKQMNASIVNKSDSHLFKPLIDHNKLQTI